MPVHFDPGRLVEDALDDLGTREFNIAKVLQVAAETKREYKYDRTSSGLNSISSFCFVNQLRYLWRSNGRSAHSALLRRELRTKLDVPSAEKNVVVYLM